MNSFCCMRLNTAAIFIGWVGAAASFIYSIFMILVFVNIDEVVKIITEGIPSDAKSEYIRPTIIIVLGVQLAINVINLTASALLVAGTIKERHLMLMPWLINSGIALVFYAIYCITVFISAITLKVDVGSTVSSLIFAALSFALQLYIWTAIYTLYKQMQANREQQRLLQQPQNSPSYTKI